MKTERDAALAATAAPLSPPSWSTAHHHQGDAAPDDMTLTAREEAAGLALPERS
ncbi:hypothetical protein [Brachybacterium sacelli]|uniref:NADH:ubiquinone oxidoreductase subunit n=1 Tax=Brachybacterium sacelli TaxID=173364 RepID=A0ABS4WYR9_9MICO|nr:hypothetical protein [Brachybacterium sacelli]MBP2381128.1 NADH:ubiquinone oxidoreductase subunit [Brachybacterium sacelli]